MKLSVVLDTCVLVPSLQRDLLLEVAFQGAYRPLLSDVTEVELVRVLQDLSRARGLGHGSLHSIIPAMNTAFPYSRVDTEQLSQRFFGLPDADDEHVVRAALLGGADLIVTWNRKDFPDLRIRTVAEVETPDDLMVRLWNSRRENVRQALRVIADRSGRHGRAMTVSDILNCLAGDLPAFVLAVRSCE